MGRRPGIGEGHVLPVLGGAHWRIPPCGGTYHRQAAVDLLRRDRGLSRPTGVELGGADHARDKDQKRSAREENHASANARRVPGLGSRNQEHFRDFPPPSLTSLRRGTRIRADTTLAVTAIERTLVRQAIERRLHARCRLGPQHRGSGARRFRWRCGGCRRSTDSRTMKIRGLITGHLIR
jgi:hypothetical protein